MMVDLPPEGGSHGVQTWRSRLASGFDRRGFRLQAEEGLKASGYGFHTRGFRLPANETGAQSFGFHTRGFRLQAEEPASVRGVDL
jgi:hypothetical protein